MLYSALIFGLLGSFHCVGMCGPIAFLLPVDRKNPKKRFFQLLSYHIGRVFMYAILGLIFGLVGKSLNLFGVQQQLSIGIGILMITIILIPSKLFNRYNFSKPIYKVVSKIKNGIGNKLKNKNSRTFFTIGYLNGLLPCGLVYMAIFGAIATGNALQGSLYMLIFGSGTIPLMTTAIYLGNFLTGKVKQRILKIIPVFVFIVGLLFILRGLGLGIPYVSPSKMVTIEQVSPKHHCH
ncbi:hypothetical protein A8C32_08070 [Flavivirga aquatica]|uniref:Urease accessory protein UreH-like transmembrane domain-containing protein n=1 Tax=Flavivirga aquatica TaxID=1849968 RepID=A0A1E5SJ40_9FLAO|nr:sulfite exporter TauE/SafE family protein [Flavivirga aquatica]OEJ99121.1 hypothetical protein A8C32_08070 [Flavivirga aquatica]